MSRTTRMSTQAYSYAAQGNLQADLWACGSPAQAGAETANNRRFWTRTSQLFPATVRGRQELAPPSASQTIPGAVRVPRTGAAFDNPSWREEPSGLRCPARQDGSPPQAKRSGPPRHRIERALRASRSRRLDRWPLPALATLPVTWRLPHSTGGRPITSKALRVKRVVGTGVPLPSHEDLPGSPPRAPGPALEKGHERQAGSGRSSRCVRGGRPSPAWVSPHRATVRPPASAGKAFEPTVPRPIGVDTTAPEPVANGTARWKASAWLRQVDRKFARENGGPERPAEKKTRIKISPS